MNKDQSANSLLKLELNFDGNNNLEVKPLESIEVMIDNENITSHFLGDDGFATNFVVAKKLQIDAAGRITSSDSVEQLITLMMGNPANQNEVKFILTLPIRKSTNTKNAKIEGTASITFGNNLGGSTTETGSLNFSLMVSGKPTYTAEAR